MFKLNYSFSLGGNDPKGLIQNRPEDSFGFRRRSNENRKKSGTAEKSPKNNFEEESFEQNFGDNVRNFESDEFDLEPKMVTEDVENFGNQNGDNFGNQKVQNFGNQNGQNFDNYDDSSFTSHRRMDSEVVPEEVEEEEEIDYKQEQEHEQEQHYDDQQQQQHYYVEQQKLDQQQQQLQQQEQQNDFRSNFEQNMFDTPKINKDEIVQIENVESVSHPKPIRIKQQQQQPQIEEDHHKVTQQQQQQHQQTNSDSNENVDITQVRTFQK